MKQKILKGIIILIIGGFGGILADQFLLPFLADVFPFSQIEFVKRTKDGTTIINKTEKITITENIAVEEAIRKISPSVVAVQTLSGSKQIIREGTGFIVFSDGLVITAADLVPEKAGQYLVFQESSSSTAQIIKRDIKNNLALLKIEKTNLPVVPLADLNGLALGERIILMGVQAPHLLGKDAGQAQKDNFYRFINLGTIRGIREETISLNLGEEDTLANGGPLINIKGEVVGLNLVNQTGLTKTAPVNIIKEFIKL